jgi:hypothetical protein
MRIHFCYTTLQSSGIQNLSMHHFDDNVVKTTFYFFLFYHLFISLNSSPSSSKQQLLNEGLFFDDDKKKTMLNNSITRPEMGLPDMKLLLNLLKSNRKSEFLILHEADN